MDNSTGVILSGLGMLIVAGYQMYEYTTGDPTTERLWIAGVALLVMTGAFYSGARMRGKRSPR